MIPEYFDLGEVPVLDHIFRENPDITHVVHLADPYPHSALQAVPREKDVPKAGMMEALLEQLAKHERDARDKIKKNKDNRYKPGGSDDEKDMFEYVPPNFVYASSFEVYPHHSLLLNSSQGNGKSTMNLLLDETQTLSTPSSLRGASKMMDEMIAKLYYDTKGIYSVGLRFFSVYGPWGVPGSPLFEMAERAVAGDLDGLNEEHEIKSFHSGLNGINLAEHEDDKDRTKSHHPSRENDWEKSIHDFVYIDDAVDAIMAAMQYRSNPSTKSASTETEVSGKQQNTPHPIIFNVASGQGHSLEDVLEVMQEYIPPINVENSDTKRNEKSGNGMGSIGSTKRAEALLGYEPQVSLKEGIVKMLAWHYDRAFPSGGHGMSNKDKNLDDGRSHKIDAIAQHGIAGCLQFDKECLRGTPVFPCASECSHKAQCTMSYYDEVIGLTQKLTANCKSVLYTVDLDDSLVSLPSANPKYQKSKSFLKGTCNLAFVSQQSLLVKSSRKASRNEDGLLRDGSWVLIPLNALPLSISTAMSDINMSSDGRVDTNQMLKLLPKLSPGLFFGSKNIKRAIYVDPDIVIDNIPKLLQESYAQPYNRETEGATAMLIGRGIPKNYFADNDYDEEEIILNLDDPNYEHQVLESTNTLVQNAAYRMVKIAVSDNLFGDGFMELLDSRWIVHGLQSDDGRLFRCDVLGEIMQWEVASDRSALEFVLGLHDMWSRVIAKASGIGPWWIGENVATVPEGKQRHSNGRRRLLEQEQEDAVAVVDTMKRNSREKVNTPVVEDNEGEKNEQRETAEDDDESEEDSQERTSGEGEAEENEKGEFVADATAQQEVTADEEKRGDSSDELQEGSRAADEKDDEESNDQESQHRDFSSYDTWMGILSSSDIKYFVRLVPSSEVGVVSI
eukprot:CAMPEP_0172379244 /NCGR_PEP_ID=MMETSP1060-20121228/69835_1 /TAXON_ID=37318 /ORGANISM="Pseudo-nitzschia pungens, Strain cf. cingulata" /LENGTH=898 /DNA_ID=CAMNT_0013106981 /DNA_START=445 /DNA_END=3141 /DNA_ORIENTATION=+